jgi:hypothetical protein
VLVVALLGLCPEARAGSRVEDLSQVLLRDPSYKVRLQAAALLGRLHDRRAVPALIQALQDGREQVTVRAMAAQALGEIGDPSARPSLERAVRDHNDEIARRARSALSRVSGEAPSDAIPSRNRVTGEKVFLVVGRMGDKTGRAGQSMRERMREFVMQKLRDTPYITLQGSASRSHGFMVDGAIKDLSTRTQGGLLEVSCEVELVVSTYPAHSIIMMTTGEAAVQEPVMRVRPRQQGTMENDALENAVKGAHQNLVQFLQAQR